MSRRLWNPAELLDHLGTSPDTRASAIVSTTIGGDLPEPLAEVLAHPEDDRSGTIRRLAVTCAWHRLPVEDLRRAVDSSEWLRSKLDGRSGDFLGDQYRDALAYVRVRHLDPRDLLPRGDAVQQPPASTPVSRQDAPAGPAAGWTPVDLSVVVEGLANGSLKRPVPTIGLRTDGKALFYRGKVNGVAGASGSGKSWDALLACVQAIAGGQHAVYIDYESDAAETVGRLLDLGADLAAITELFLYIQPDLKLNDGGAAALADLVRSTGTAVVVIDSVGESMAVEGDRPNDDDDTARWFRRLPTMLAALGPAVIVIDHVTKADDREPGLWPIGSQRKRAAISGAQYMQRVGKPFAKGQPGTARIICAKDRGGNYKQGEHVASLTVTPDGPVLMELLAPATPTSSDGTTGGPFRPTTLMERCSRVLEASSEPLSLSQLHGLVSGQERGKTSAVQVLVDESYVRRSPGPRNAFLHTSLREYRRADDPLSDSYTGRETVEPTPISATVSVSVERETERRSLDRRAETVRRRSETVGEAGEDHVQPHQPALVAVGARP